MKRIGKVLHLSKNNNWILRTKVKPILHKNVFDEKLKKIGKIFDIFGPVTMPYISVKPLVMNPEKYLAQVLYIMN